MSQVWAWFNKLNNARHYSDMGSALPITYSEIESWSNVTETYPTPFEVDVIKLIDGVSMSTKKEE